MQYFASLKSSGYYIRLLILVVLWFLVLPIIFHALKSSFHLDLYARIPYSTVVTPALFFLLLLKYQRQLLNFNFIFKWRESGIFLGLSSLCLLAYLSLYNLLFHLYVQGTTLAYWQQIILVYFTLAGLYVGILMSIFGLNFLWSFKRPLIGLVIFTILYYGLQFWLEQYWGYFSYLTTLISTSMVKLFYSELYVVYEGYNAGVFLKNFSVGIGQTCSGTELILLFFTLYLGCIWLISESVSRVKSILFLCLGLLGTIGVNGLRIAILLVLGIHNPTMAMEFFHDHTAWLLFVGYFLLYLSVTYPLIRR